MIYIMQKICSDGTPLCAEMAYHIYSIMLNRMKKTDEEYTQLLHGGRHRTPISVSVQADAKDAKRGTVSLCLFNEEARAHFYPVLTHNAYQLRRLRCTLTVESEHEQHMDEDTLCTQWLLPENHASIPRYFELRFLTPTAFYEHRHFLPMPELSLLLKTAAARFNQLELYSQIEDIELLDMMRHALVVHECRIETVPFRFKPDTALCGFVGRLRMELAGEDAVNRLLYMLLYTAQFTGVGARTALGMGKIQLVPTGSHRKNKAKHR